MELKQLKKRTKQQINKNWEEWKERCNDKPTEVMRWFGKQYKGTEEEQKRKTMLFLERRRKQETEQKTQQIENIEATKDLTFPLIITVEWKKNYTWGTNPTATDNFGNSSASIGGCGYDKLSTAVAEVLNQHNYILKLLYEEKERYLRKHKIKDDNEIHRQILGYGSGYGTLPYFEGGVGVNCFQNIFSRLGLRMRTITSTKTIDVFMICGKPKKGKRKEE